MLQARRGLERFLSIVNHNTPRLWGSMRGRNDEYDGRPTSIASHQKSGTIGTQLSWVFRARQRAWFGIASGIAWRIFKIPSRTVGHQYIS